MCTTNDEQIDNIKFTTGNFLGFNDYGVQGIYLF